MGPCKCIWQIFTLSSCKWFTFTRDLHIIYIIIDIYRHNTCSNYELPFVGSKKFHLDACISKYVHPSYVRIVIHISYTHHIKFEAKNYAQFLFQSIFLKRFSLQSLNKFHPYETIKKMAIILRNIYLYLATN